MFVFGYCIYGNPPCPTCVPTSKQLHRVKCCWAETASTANQSVRKLLACKAVQSIHSNFITSEARRAAGSKTPPKEACAESEAACRKCGILRAKSGGAAGNASAVSSSLWSSRSACPASCQGAVHWIRSHTKRRGEEEDRGVGDGAQPQMATLGSRPARNTLGGTARAWSMKCRQGIVQ